MDTGIASTQSQTKSTEENSAFFTTGAFSYFNFPFLDSLWERRSQGASVALISVPIYITISGIALYFNALGENILTWIRIIDSIANAQIRFPFSHQMAGFGYRVAWFLSTLKRTQLYVLYYYLHHFGCYLIWLWNDVDNIKKVWRQITNFFLYFDIGFISVVLFYNHA